MEVPELQFPTKSYPVPTPAVTMPEGPAGLAKIPSVSPLKVIALAWGAPRYTGRKYCSANACSWRKPQLSIVRYFHFLFVLVECFYLLNESGSLTEGVI